MNSLDWLSVTMKVTVCFGSTRVVVPCGEGSIRVRDLISKAVPRYKKATGKPSDSWVTVHNLRQLDGGILDPDDRLNDVADDREQIIAIYDEAANPNQGDGTSASDDDSENRSPDIFKNSDHQLEPFSRNGIDITGDQLNGTPPPLHVRRGSEPALNRLSPIPPYSSAPADPCKRWSAAPVIEDQKPPSSTPLKNQLMSPPFDGYPGERGEGSGEEKLPSSSSASSSASSHHSATTTTLSRFSRDDKRCSIQILSDNTNMGRWAEAVDRVIESGGFYGKTEGTRKEPLGGAASTPPQSRNPSIEDRSRPNSRLESSHLVVLNNDGSPLGIHVIPSTDRSGLDQGLLVEGIESDGRVARDGRINVHDIIIEINGKSLRNVTFHEAQEIFKDAMKDLELRLTIIKRRENRNFIPGTERTSFGSARKAPVSLSSRTQAVMLHSNTRRIGKRLTINLQKGQHGLGFSITTRDNPAGGEAPIYIKNILPKGAAIEDGTLRIGDRLLEVNGVHVTGCSQSDVASLLRQIPVGGLTSLIVSRQEKIADLGIDTAEESGGSDNCPSPKLPRQLPTEKVPEDSLMFPWKQREILTFEIPVHDSERAGLGVSVKGKTSSGPNGSIDLGIFVKNVIHGGAASRDGRLKQNDQLVNINGLSLLGKSNSEAMKTLRTAMHQEYRLRLLNLESSFHLESNNPNQDSSMRSQSPHDYDSQMHQQLGSLSPGMITLTIARRVDGSKANIGSFSNGGEGFTTPTTDYSGTSDTSDNTVIFNSKKDSDFERNIDGSTEMNHCEDFQLTNPVIQRLTGASNAALRNESYYKATHDTWNNSQFKNNFGVNEKERETRDSPLDVNKFGSPTVNLPSRDTILIDDEYDTPTSVGRRISSQSSAPSTSAEEHPSDAYVSQSSLEESIAGFSRDQPGRQSMSEKRHATLDAKSTDTYQRNKKAREDREKYRQEMYAEMGLDGISRGSSKMPRTDVGAVGPGLGMRKSSSLESLQTMVQEITLEESGLRAGSGRVPRGRGCNESFRAAVDRSYDAPLANVGQLMETLAEEESESSGSGFGRGNSRQSSLSSSAEDQQRRRNKKKQGIFKGLGSMFRFGKHRRSVEHPHTRGEGQVDIYSIENENSQENHFHKMMENNSHSLHQGGGEQNLSCISGVTLPDDDSGGPSRSERMHQLRAEHQRRHVQRNGIYPTDTSEDQYDSAIKQRLDPVPPEPKAEIQHIRSRSYDFYGGDGMGRPGSRTGVMDPHKFSHYVNYEQIQMHLRKNKEQERLAKLASQQYQDFRDKQTSREQREYQSQRCVRETSHQQRPVSNYFEYESVQAMMTHAQHNNSTSTASLPRRHQQLLPQQQQQQQPATNNQHTSSRSIYPPNHGPTVISVNSSNRSNSTDSGNPKGFTKNVSQSRMTAPYPLFSHSRGQPPPPPPQMGAREGHYASSGYRPASQYNAIPIHQMQNTSLTVPDSKV